MDLDAINPDRHTLCWRLHLLHISKGTIFAGLWINLYLGRHPLGPLPQLKRDALKANRIVNYFASNPKDNPLVMTIALLGGYFSKILTYHYLPDKSQNNVASELKVNPFFVKDYLLAAGNYPPKKTMDVISLLRQYDLRSKGKAGTDHLNLGDCSGPFGHCNFISWPQR